MCLFPLLWTLADWHMGEGAGQLKMQVCVARGHNTIFRIGLRVSSINTLRALWMRVRGCDALKSTVKLQHPRISCHLCSPEVISCSLSPFGHPASGERAGRIMYVTSCPRASCKILRGASICLELLPRDRNVMRCQSQLEMDATWTRAPDHLFQQHPPTSFFLLNIFCLLVQAHD